MYTLRYGFTLLVALFSLLASNASFSENSAQPFKQFGKHTVVFTVFGSGFLEPDIANAYGFSRGKDQALINISVNRRPVGSSLGLPAVLKGSATNLMQQQTQLEFVEIKEPDTVYYLAPFRFINEEIVHFDLNIQVEGENYDVKFTKKLYVD